MRAVLLAALLCWSGAARGGPILLYEATPLGTPGEFSSTAFGLNDAGVVVGVSRLASGKEVAFVDGDSGMSLANSPSDATMSGARDVNLQGTVAGTSHSQGKAQATVWSGGHGMVIGDLGGGESYGMAVNDAGQIVGGSTTAAGSGHAFLYNGRSWTDIGAEWGGLWSAAYGINDSEQVAGYRESSAGVFRGFLWSEGGGALTLGTLGGRNSYALGINNSGVVVGHASVVSGHTHAFLYGGGLMIDLGTLGGGSSFAYAINDAGLVVGHSWLAGVGATHAFLYQGGAMVDLNTLLLNGAGWELTEAYAINSAGQIAGAGLYNGQRTAFRLDPVGRHSGLASVSVPMVENPEPGTVSMMVLGLAMVGLGAWRRRSLTQELMADRRNDALRD